MAHHTEGPGSTKEASLEPFARSALVGIGTAAGTDPVQALLSGGCD
ncbi:hypothetical protein OHA40_04705 [Nocardia sp. NBC_00508]|nr:hypothetical protein [Nocardia sp. NBC_00508]WUD67450.1 hypothetical protein OHA40_04705 [Nocardia sp. NBC_00508]